LLPFVGSTFDVVLSGFVITHVDDVGAALTDMARVLRPRGRVGLSAWAQDEGAFTSAWSETAARFVDTAVLNAAAERILPGESRFARAGGLQEALRTCGFTDLRSGDVDLDFELTVAEFIEGREVGASGRALGALLLPGEWERFRAEVRALFASRFPAGVAYQRRVFIATGARPV
jgi:SAM-dependent methyltransferase